MLDSLLEFLLESPAKVQVRGLDMKTIRTMLAAMLLMTAGAVAGLASAAGAVSTSTTAIAAGRAPACPPGYTCTSDPVDFIDTSPTADPQFIVSDPSNAPQFSVGTGGAASWANPFCVTNNPLTHPPLRFLACIGGTWGNGQGQPVVTLFDSHGHPATLTIADIRFLHRLETAR